MMVSHRTFSSLCGSLISLSPTIIKLSVAPTVLVTNGKTQTDIPPSAGVIFQNDKTRENCCAVSTAVVSNEDFLKVIHQHFQPAF